MHIENKTAKVAQPDGTRKEAALRGETAHLILSCSTKDESTAIQRQEIHSSVKTENAGKASAINDVAGAEPEKRILLLICLILEKSCVYQQGFYYAVRGRGLY